MKLHALVATGLLIMGFNASAADSTAPPAPTPAAVVLDGIMNLQGDKWAFFKVNFSGGVPDAEFMLAEGQARFGIQLVAINPQSRTAVIRNQDRTQTLSICQTPALLAGTVSGVPAAAGSGDGFSAAGRVSASNEETLAAEASRFAHPVNAAGWGGKPNAATGNSGNNSTSANDSGTASTGSGANTAADGSNTTHERLYQWWVNDAQKIEQARMETAQRVLAGEWPPYPLTPLTPAGTPPQLIGPDSLFMEHGPGMIVAGN